jgi:hypothetical protein
MRCLRKAVALGLALWLAPAAMALCLLPLVELTVAEQECCQQMGPDCGQSRMPDSHSCCETKAPTATVALAAAESFSVAPPAELGGTVMANAMASPADLAPLHGIFLAIHSPPESPPGSLTILRI